MDSNSDNSGDPSSPAEQPDPAAGSAAGSAATEIDRLFANVRTVHAAADGGLVVPPLPRDAETPPPLPYEGVNERGVVVAKVHCRSCGYELRGLVMSDACPECRWPVMRSVAGAWLVNSPSSHIRTLRTGITLVIAAQFAALGGGLIVMVLAIGLAATSSFVSGTRLIELGIGALTAIAGLVGWWLFSTPDPALAAGEQRTASRRVLRGFALATLGGYIVALVVQVLYSTGFIPAGNPIMIGGPTGTPIGSPTDLAVAALSWLTTLLGVAVTSIAMAHLANVAARVPAPDLQRDAKRMVWLVWVLVFVPCFGGLISFVMLLIYLFRARSALGTVLAQQQQSGLAEA